MITFLTLIVEDLFPEAYLRTLFLDVAEFLDPPFYIYENRKERNTRSSFEYNLWQNFHNMIFI